MIFERAEVGSELAGFVGVAAGRSSHQQRAVAGALLPSLVTLICHRSRSNTGARSFFAFVHSMNDTRQTSSGRSHRA